MSTSAEFQRRLDINHVERIKILKNKRKSVDFNPMREFLRSEKKVKIDADVLSPIKKQSSLHTYFSKRTPHGDQQIRSQANPHPPNAESIEETKIQDLEMIKYGGGIRIQYSNSLRGRAGKLLATKSLNFVYHYFNHKIPRSTLQYWGQEKMGEKVGGPIQFPEVDTEIYGEFLDFRGGFLPVSDSMLQQLAKDVKKDHLKILAQDIRGFEVSRAPNKAQELGKIKEGLNLMGYEQGWADKFKKRYHIVKRKVTGKVMGGFSYYMGEIPKWFGGFDKICLGKSITAIYNFDGTAIFWDLPASHVLDVQGKKYIGLASHPKSKEKCTVILCMNNDGGKLPPCVIPRVSGPRSKAYSDHPTDPFPAFDTITTNLIRGTGALVPQAYSGWNNPHLMVGHYLPHLARYLGGKYKKAKSLFAFDNASCHKTGEVGNTPGGYHINYGTPPPNSTQFIQPMDSLINRDSKSRIRKSPTDWLIKNFTNVHCRDEEEAKEENKEPKDFPQPPPKGEILKWILKSYEDVKQELIIKSPQECALTSLDQRPKLFEKIKSFTFDDVKEGGPGKKSEKKSGEKERGDPKALTGEWGPVYLTSESSDAGDIDIDDLDLNVEIESAESAENDEKIEEEGQEQEMQIISSKDKNKAA